MASLLPDAIDTLDLTNDEADQMAQIVMAAAARILPATLSIDPTQPRLLQSMSLILEKALNQGEENPGFHCWRGQVPCIDEDALADLVAESEGMREAACAMSNHLIAAGGKVATRLLRSSSLASFIQAVFNLESEITPTETYFHYYESAAHFAEFHVDKSDFTINVLMVLAHSWGADPRSSFYLVPPGELPDRMDLGVGDAVVFESTRVLHCRSAPWTGEQVTTISFGFCKGSV